MKIKKSQLQRIISEEYSKLFEQTGDQSTEWARIQDTLTRQYGPGTDPQARAMAGMIGWEWDDARAEWYPLPRGMADRDFGNLYRAVRAEAPAASRDPAPEPTPEPTPAPVESAATAAYDLGTEDYFPVREPSTGPPVLARNMLSRQPPVAEPEAAPPAPAAEPEPAREEPSPTTRARRGVRHTLSRHPDVRAAADRAGISSRSMARHLMRGNAEAEGLNLAAIVDDVDLSPSEERYIRRRMDRQGRTGVGDEYHRQARALSSADDVAYWFGLDVPETAEPVDDLEASIEAVNRRLADLASEPDETITGSPDAKIANLLGIDPNEVSEADVDRYHDILDIDRRLGDMDPDDEVPRREIEELGRETEVQRPLSRPESSTEDEHLGHIETDLPYDVAPSSREQLDNLLTGFQQQQTTGRQAFDREQLERDTAAWAAQQEEGGLPSYLYHESNQKSRRKQGMKSKIMYLIERQLQLQEQAGSRDISTMSRAELEAYRDELMSRRTQPAEPPAPQPTAETPAAATTRSAPAAETRAPVSTGPTGPVSSLMGDPEVEGAPFSGGFFAQDREGMRVRDPNRSTRGRQRGDTASFPERDFEERSSHPPGLYGVGNPSMAAPHWSHSETWPVGPILWGAFDEQGRDTRSYGSGWPFLYPQNPIPEGGHSQQRENINHTLDKAVDRLLLEKTIDSEIDRYLYGSRKRNKK